MGSIISLIIAAIPKAILAIVGKLLTDAFMEKILIQVTIYGLEKLAENTASPLDDKIVSDIKKQLEAPQNGASK